MKNHIIDESICYENLNWIFTRYYQWSEPLIKQRRKRNSDIWLNFSNYAEKWSRQADEESNKAGKKMVSRVKTSQSFSIILQKYKSYLTEFIGDIKLIMRSKSN